MFAGSSTDQSLRILSLSLLVVQNSALSLVITSGRHVAKPYNTAMAVLLCELGKLLVSGTIMCYEKLQWIRRPEYREYQRIDQLEKFSEKESSSRHLEKQDYNFQETARTVLMEIRRDVLSRDCMLILIPSLLYVVQNNLQLLAAGHLSPTNFQIFSQLKIATTAFFSVTLLERKISTQKKLAIAQLMCGVMLFQYSTSKTAASISHSAISSPSEQPELAANHLLWGVATITLSCLISGFSGVYTERVIKSSKTSLWTNNVQLSLCSLLPASLPVAIGYCRTPNFNPMDNFGPWAWSAVLLNICGGLLVALTVKYANCILKSFATSVALVATFFISYLFSISASEINFTSLVSVLGVALSILLYNRPDNSEKATATQRISLLSPSSPTSSAFSSIPSSPTTFHGTYFDSPKSP